MCWVQPNIVVKIGLGSQEEAGLSARPATSWLSHLGALVSIFSSIMWGSNACLRGLLYGLNKRMHTKLSAQDPAHWRWTEYIKYYRVCSLPHLWYRHAVQVQAKRSSPFSGLPRASFSDTCRGHSCACNSEVQEIYHAVGQPWVSRRRLNPALFLRWMVRRSVSQTRSYGMEWALGSLSCSLGLAFPDPKPSPLPRLLFWVPFLNQPACEPFLRFCFWGNPG